jgi:inner membrane transporter RhtA
VNRPTSTIPPEAAFVLGAVSQYLGAAVAVGLFDHLRPATVAVVRVASAAVIIVVTRRPWRRRWTRADLGWATLFGVALASMNLSIYLALEELPLGNAVAIEFLGPITVAAAGTRTARSAIALLTAAAGVVILAGVQSEGTVRGVGFALLAGLFWAGYIVLGHRVARRGTAIDGLGVGMLAGAVAISPFGVSGLGEGLERPSLLMLAGLAGLLSNVVPYVIDQLVMRHISRGRFAFLQALLPMTAVVVGLVTLSQTPGPREVLGIGLVVVAIAVRGSREQ